MNEVLLAILKMKLSLYRLNESNKINESDIEKVSKETLETYTMIATLNEVEKEASLKDVTAFIRRSNYVIASPGSILIGRNSSRNIDINKINFNRFNAFKKSISYLPNSVIETLDKDTNNILMQLPNPTEEKTFDIRGLVVGMVQMGKTTNFSGLINKAIDSGYDLIFVFTGTIKDLRNQTQKRLEYSCIGESSFNFSSKLVGIGEYLNENNLIACTFLDQINDRGKIIDGDVSENILNTRKYSEGKQYIFIATRSSTVVDKLIEWVKTQKFFNPSTNKAEQVSALIIADECDQACINTKNFNELPTANNAKLRTFANLFKKMVHIGYTATPFANIFINPNPTDKDIYGQDFFPKDFIYLINPPNNYLGPNEFFGEKSYPFIEPISDEESLRDELGNVSILSKSLTKAIHRFIFNGAILKLRGLSQKHHTMIINIDYRKTYQNQLYNLIESYLNKLRNEIQNGNDLIEPVKLSV